MNAPLSPVVLLNAVRQARLVREAETSLIAFTQLVWDVIEPGVQFKDNWHLHAIAEHLEAITHGELENLIINIPPGCMKLCADSTVVPTPQGWKTHKDLQVGDQVFGPDGKPRNIVAVSPEGVADLEVVFSNGEVIKCNGDHLWTVFDRYGRKERTLSTRELKSKKLHEGGRSRFQVGDYEALEFAEKELLIHPYFLGCWLGDGTHNKPAITHHEDDVEHVAKLEALGYYVRVAHKTGPSTLCSSFTKQGVGKKLQVLSVWKNKHIPDDYMHGSIEQRLELLAGLIDTDGHVDEAGRVLFSTCSDVLARQVEKLCFSLGFRVSVFSRSAPGYLGVSSSKTAYQLSFHPNRVIPTALPRKKVSRISALRRAVGICEIREAKNPEVGHCITVDRADGLYLVGTSCITTHNSILVSVAWPAWEWKDNPALRYLGASYGADLAIRDAAKTRDILFSPLYQQLWPKTQVKRGADNKLKYELTAGGWRIATSVGGRATGEHPDRKIVDDPHNAKQAESDAERAAALVWFDRTLSSRGKSRGAKTVVVMQRLHESDVTGHILAEKFDDYEHLCLPMTYEGRRFKTRIGWEDPRTTEGSLLWPEMFPPKSVNELSKLLGEYGTAGQLQQRPAPAGGGILKVKHFQLWPVDRELPVFEKVVQSYDGAYSEEESKHNDPSACTVWGTFSHGKIRGAMLLDAWDEYLGYPQFRQKVVDEWHAVYGKTKDRKGRKADVVLVEKKSSGISILQDLRAAKIPATPYDPGRADKVQRAHNVAPMLELDVLYIPESKKEPGKPVMWARKFLDQVEKFPNSEHDDYVDTFTQCLILLRDEGWFELNFAKEDPVEEAKYTKKVNPYG